VAGGLNGQPRAQPPGLRRGDDGGHLAWVGTELASDAMADSDMSMFPLGEPTPPVDIKGADYIR
jgi:hypothetical protein